MANKLAIVTGASTGIGFELAEVAAEQGYDLIVVADEPLIDAAAADFRVNGAGSVTSVEADLSTIDGVDRLIAAAGGRPVDVLCANAGSGHGGAFLDQPVDSWRHTIDTNITGTLYLLQRVIADMVARGEGRVLVTGSIAGFVPGSFNAVYNSTKSFINNFTDALRDELKDHDGVTLTTLMPGATDTEFFARADMLDTNVGESDKKDDPAKVARDGWEAMMAGKADIVSGWHNKIQVAGSHVTPQKVMAAAHRKMAEPHEHKD